MTKNIKLHQVIVLLIVNSLFPSMVLISRYFVVVSNLPKQISQTISQIKCSFPT